MINNEFYNDLEERWYTANDHPIALLRAENAVRIPWILEKLSPSSTVLDIGCGAGFLANCLAQKGHLVSAIDLSETTLATARRHDTTQSVQYIRANAYSLPFPDAAFDAVSAMDILEHVEEPHLLIAEASRVLKKGGLFFFHTFNRTFWSYLLVIKGVEWFVQNAPKNMHVYSLFIPPSELKNICEKYQLHTVTLTGFTPDLMSRPFWKMLLTRKVPPDFKFRFSKNLQTGYCGYAKKG